MDEVGEPRGCAAGGKRVFVHVGSPKSGTTSVQDVLWRNRKALAEHGVHYPADRFDEHFLAALDLQQLSWGGLEDEATGALDRLVERVNAVEGTVVLSSEVFAAASAEQAGRLLSALDGEVHVVFSARDLARQIPAEWQELVKHRHRLTYDDLLTDLTQGSGTRPESQWFWSVQHWPDVLERWGGTLAPDRVHVVTVPQRGADHGVLLARFWQVFGIDAAWLTDRTARPNVGLDPVAAAALRRLNERLPGERLASRHYRPLVREAIVHRGMTDRPGTPRITLPPHLLPWASGLSETWTRVLRDRGYDVVGDLDELQVVEGPATWHDPDQTSDGDLLEAAEHMLDLAVCNAADLFEELHHERYDLQYVREEREAALTEVEQLRGELARAGAEHDRTSAELTSLRTDADELVWLREHPAADAKRRVVDAAARHPSIDGVLGLYRAVRDRARGRG